MPDPQIIPLPKRKKEPPPEPEKGFFESLADKFFPPATLANEIKKKLPDQQHPDAPKMAPPPPPRT